VLRRDAARGRAARSGGWRARRRRSSVLSQLTVRPGSNLSRGAVRRRSPTPR
jgi:hypothetical protein